MSSILLHQKTEQWSMCTGGRRGHGCRDRGWPIVESARSPKAAKRVIEASDMIVAPLIDRTPITSANCWDP